MIDHMGMHVARRRPLNRVLSEGARAARLRHRHAGVNGAPGLPPEYHANYYGAFVFDPDGTMPRPSATYRNDA